MPEDQPTRICRRCGEEKPSVRYYKGLRICIDCSNRQTYFRRANKHLPTVIEQIRAKTEKTCKVCGQTKPVSEFPRNEYRCRSCASAYKLSLDKAKSAEEQAAIRERKRLWYHSHKHVAQAYHERNRDRIREKARAQYEKYYPENREKYNEWARNRRARVRGAEGTHTAQDVKTLYKKQKGKCANPACGKSLKRGYDVDHIVSLVNGGTNWPDNLQLLCHHCNMTKSRKDPYRWAQENGRLFV